MKVKLCCRISKNGKPYYALIAERNSNDKVLETILTFDVNQISRATGYAPYEIYRMPEGTEIVV